MAYDLQVTKLHIEMDCKSIVSKLQSEQKDLSPIGPIIEEVRQLLASMESWRITWVRREANGAAHLLAKEAVSNNLCKVWLHVPPDFILRTVSDEIPMWES